MATDLNKVKEIKDGLLTGNMNYTWTELKQAILHLYDCYESTKKSLDEANQAMLDLEDMDLDLP